MFSDAIKQDNNCPLTWEKITFLRWPAFLEMKHEKSRAKAENIVCFCGVYEGYGF